MDHIDDPTYYLTLPSLEAAVSALCERVFGAKLVIETADTPTTHPATTRVEPLKGETCPRCLWSNGDLINYGATGRPDWICHGCATQENQRLGRIDTALLKLRGIKAITSLDAAEALSQAGAVIEDKNATITRLTDKLTVTAEVMQDNIDIKAEAERLHTLWHEAQHALDLLRDQRRKDTAQTEFHHAAWLGSLDTIKKLTAKIDELNTEAEHTEAKDPSPTTPPSYRRLEEGELIRTTDEWLTEGGAWLVRDYVGAAERFNGGTHQPHRRKV